MLRLNRGVHTSQAMRIPCCHQKQAEIPYQKRGVLLTGSLLGGRVFITYLVTTLSAMQA